MMKSHTVRVALALVGTMPMIAFAAPSPSFKSIVITLVSLLQTAFGVMFWVITLYVLWALVQRWMKPGGEDYTEGRRTLVAGIFGLVIMASLWGLVAFVQTLFR